jgi:hypothetical protein
VQLAFEKEKLGKYTWRMEEDVANATHDIAGEEQVMQQALTTSTDKAA